MPALASILGGLTGPAELIPALVVAVVLVSAAVTLVLAAVRRRDDVPVAAEVEAEEPAPAVR